MRNQKIARIEHLTAEIKSNRAEYFSLQRQRKAMVAQMESLKAANNKLRDERKVVKREIADLPAPTDAATPFTTTEVASLDTGSRRCPQPMSGRRPHLRMAPRGVVALPRRRRSVLPTTVLRLAGPESRMGGPHQVRDRVAARPGRARRVRRVLAARSRNLLRFSRRPRARARPARRRSTLRSQGESPRSSPDAESRPSR